MIEKKEQQKQLFFVVSGLGYLEKLRNQDNKKLNKNENFCISLVS